ncbi:MAG: hypothetical protein AAF267_19845 [Deinococcota bacterium]
MKQYKLTFVGIIVSFGLWLTTALLDLDLFEQVVEFLESLEAFEVDEFIIPSMIFFLCLSLNITQLYRKQGMRIGSLKIYKAMLTSTHHILNNFLNQMQLFKMTAESTEGFPEEVLQLYDEIMDEALAQIDQLGNVTSIDEKTIVDSVAPQIDIFPDDAA